MSATVLMSSCGLYNKYERPDVNTTGLVRDVKSATDTLAVTDTTSFGNLPWRSVFTDNKLQSLIETGLAHNVDLLNAALNVKMVETQLTVAKLAFVPSFTFTPQGTISSWDGNKATKTYSSGKCKLEHRPLRQPAEPKAQRTDGIACHKGLSAGSEDEHHLGHSKHVLHPDDA